MLRVFVNHERDKVLLATYGFEETINFVYKHKIKQVEKYNDVEIYEVEE